MPTTPGSNNIPDQELIKQIVSDAMKLPQHQRVAYITFASRGNEAMQGEVQVLVDALDKAGGFMHAVTAAGAVMNGLEHDSHESVGSQIGPYKLLELIGEGAFGSVFRAEQAEPVRRQVALKIIKLGMDTRQVVARFEQERQALAIMDHPNIARVFDAGTTELGRPYFVMEYVKGRPITEYCDAQDFSLRKRLDLFMQVCRAVQHAHTKGVIHRDIKPRNVLVSTHDGRPHVKVIDFGIAKATAQSMADEPIYTAHLQLLGTIEYMSPEQAGGSLDIDTRTDVYSLGVLLYELLTGTTPFEGQRLRSAAYGEMQRIIKDEEPPSPSLRVTMQLRSGGSLPSESQKTSTRWIDVKSRPSDLKGELDWIVMMALEKDRARRYITPNQLAEDVERYLTGEPIIAAPPGAGYRLVKFVRRNRVLVVAAAAVFMSLTIGLVSTTWQTRIANKRAEEVQKVSDFLAKMLSGVNPTEAGMLLTADVKAKFEKSLVRFGVPESARAALLGTFGNQWNRLNATDMARDVFERAILRPAVEAIEKDFKDQPVVEANLRQTLADRYAAFGLYDVAMPLQMQALSTRRRVRGEEHPDTLNSINNLGTLLIAKQKLDEAEPLLREVLEKRRRVLGEKDLNTLISISNLGSLLQRQGKLDEAAPYYREALEKRRAFLSEEHPHTLTSINNMGFFLRAQGKFKEAEPYIHEALEKRRRVLGEDDPSTLNSLDNLGLFLQSQGRLSDAEPYHREVMEKLRRVRGEEHPVTLTSIHNFASLLQKEGKLGEAEPYQREALEKRRRVLGEEHTDTLISLTNLGTLLMSQGRLQEAEPYLREVLEKNRRVRVPGDRETLISLNNLGVLLIAQGRFDEAETYLREVLEERQSTLSAKHQDRLISMIGMGKLYAAQGKYDNAVTMLAPIERAVREVFTGEGAPWLASLLMTLGNAYAGRGEFKVAEANLLEAHVIYGTSQGGMRKEIHECGQAIVDLYTDWHAAEPTLGYNAKAAEWNARLEMSQPSEQNPRPEKQQ